jgi:hypothetical protein
MRGPAGSRRKGLIDVRPADGGRDKMGAFREL